MNKEERVAHLPGGGQRPPARHGCQHVRSSTIPTVFPAIPASLPLPSFPIPFRLPFRRSGIPSVVPVPLRRSGIPSVVPASPPSFRASPPSFRHPLRRSGIPSVVPASPPSFQHLLRRSSISSVVPASPPSFRHLLRRSGISSVVPASPPSFRVIPASLPSFLHPLRHSGESRNPRRLPGVVCPRVAVKAHCMTGCVWIGVNGRQLPCYLASCP